jgi:hypothetical protein
VLLQDHERAYFDSADWVLGKVVNKILRPVIFRGAPHIQAISNPAPVAVCSKQQTAIQGLLSSL